MKKLLFLLLAFMNCLVYNGCKKGEEDPFISLRSRKSRVEGVWKVVKMEENMDVSYTPVGYYAFKWKEKTTTDGESAIYGSDFYNGESRTGKVNEYTYTFRKEGTWEHKKNIKWIEVIGSDTTVIISQTVSSGTWDFLNGVGESKKKQEMVVFVKNEVYTESTSSKNYNGQIVQKSLITQREYSYNGENWNLIRLANKEMIVEIPYKDLRMSTYDSQQNGANYNFSGNTSMTLIKE